VFADDQIRFAVIDDPDRAAVLDAFCAARLPVICANCVVIDVAHHVDDLAGHRFFTSRTRLSVLVMREREWRGRERRDDDYREDVSESFESR